MRRRYIFRGRVQGVGFRATARQIAGRYPVTGWVRNEPDGSVLLEAQGLPSDLDRLIGDLKGLLGGYIASASSSELPDLPAEQRFVIQH